MLEFGELVTELCTAPSPMSLGSHKVILQWNETFSDEHSLTCGAANSVWGVPFWGLLRGTLEAKGLGV